ncbi:condensation domain-containing protein, partial [Mycobacterium asiaticum]|uniref:condensation domain-containing protein n=1 Tax=Mycobacterium asiaticum TaxID=1790 RepID=UPI000ABE402F
QRLPAAAPYRNYVRWLADRDLDAARTVWRKVLADLESPTLVGPRNRLNLGPHDGPHDGPRDIATFCVPERTTRAVGELARACRTTVNTVLQGAFAQVLMWLTGQQDVVFGITVSGRPAEVVGADSMVGLLINTVPVRVRLSPSMSAADLLARLHRVHNETLEHQHLALTEIHRLSGHDRLFDTVL